jgi:hypothetical protein
MKTTTIIVYQLVGQPGVGPLEIPLRANLDLGNAVTQAEKRASTLERVEKSTDRKAAYGAAVSGVAQHIEGSLDVTVTLKDQHRHTYATQRHKTPVVDVAKATPQ